MPTPELAVEPARTADSLDEELLASFYPDRGQWAALLPVLRDVDFECAAAAYPKDVPWPKGDLSRTAATAVHDARRSTPFADATARLWATELTRLEAALRADATGPAVTDTAITDVLRQTIETLATRTVRVLITDLHRLAAAGTLMGETPEDRFTDYLRIVSDSAHLRGLAEAHSYLLASGQVLLSGRTSQVARIRKLLLRKEFADPVVSMEFGAGDTHRGGQSTSLIELQDGRRLVYKPRDLAIDAAFYETCARIFGADGVEFERPTIHLGDGDALMEHLDTQLPRPSETTDYYRNLGRMAATLYLLGGHDVHFENVIARGAMPVPIDLECLFRGRRLDTEELSPSATLTISKQIADSVLASMILPTAVEGGADVFRVGAAGMLTEQMSPVRMFTVQNPGRDDMHIVLQHQPMKMSLSVPEIDPGAASVHDIMDAVADGVQRTLHTVRRQPDLYAGLVRELFRGTRARYLNAPSMGYGQVLRMMTHPSVAADPRCAAYAASRASVFAEFSSASLLQGEVEDLLRGDVPLFEFDPSSRSITSANGLHSAEILAAAPLDDAVERILNLDADAVARQARFARLAFVGNIGPEVEPTGFQLAEAAPAADVRDCLEIATAIGADLLAERVEASRVDDVPNWLDIKISATGVGLWSPGPMDQFLYGGFTGTACFLWELGRVSGHDRFADAGLEVLTHFAHQCLENPGMLDDFGVGASCGTGGIAHSFLSIGRAACDDATLLRAGRQLVVDSAARVRDAPGEDYMSGIGGLLAACAAIDRDELLGADGHLAEATARRCITSLLHRISDDTAEVTGFSGFAHGISGLRPYVQYWSSLPGAAELSADLECRLDNFRIADDDGWHTSRQHRGRAFGWCHGSPGVLLGEVLTQQAGGPQSARLDHAARLTEEEGFGRAFSLCHGDLGNLEILRAAYLHRDGDATVADRARPRLLAGADALQRVATPPRGTYTRSVMVGRCGIGYSALRATDDSVANRFLWL